MKLNWHPLAHYIDIPAEISGKGSSGVYLWGFSIKNSFVPYYVGKARNVPWRLTEHLSRLLGGEYTIYDKQHLVDFWNHEPIYGQISIAKKLEFFRDRRCDLRTQLAEHVDAMVDSFHFTWAEISQEHFREYAGSAERGVIDLIGKDRLINHRLGEPLHEVDLGNLSKILS